MATDAIEEAGVRWKSLITGMAIGALAIAALPAGADNGDPTLLGERNTARSGTVMTSSRGVRTLKLVNLNVDGDAAAAALELVVPTGYPPMVLESQAKVANLNADLLDGLDSTGFAASAHGHAWSDLTSEVPVGLSDGDDDALGGLSCDPGQVAKVTGGVWTCGDDLDTVDGGDAETLDTLDSTDFAASGHDHDTDYLAVDATAADSDLLSGLPASTFQQVPGPVNAELMPNFGDGCIYQGGFLLGHTSAGASVCSHHGTFSTLTESATTYGTEDTQHTALGDLDGDGDLDAFVANYYETANAVLLNVGTGTFADTGQTLGVSSSNWPALGDLDGDGDLDAVVSNNGAAQQVWANDGTGTFTAGQAIGDGTWGATAVALADFDDDGDLDAFFGVSDLTGNQVWLNDGTGTFTDTGQSLGTRSTAGLGVSDFDDDGDLDVYSGNYSGTADTVWENQGDGTFLDSGQTLGSNTTYGVAVGDVDGDGDDDVCAIAEYNGCVVWVNDGDGGFTAGDGVATGNRTMAIAFGDLDGDGDLDVYLAHSHAPDEIWWNDGSGDFTDSGITVSEAGRSYGVSLGDLDHDGDLDVFLSVFGANRVFLVS